MCVVVRSNLKKVMKEHAKEPPRAVASRSRLKKPPPVPPVAEKKRPPLGQDAQEGALVYGGFTWDPYKVGIEPGLCAAYKRRSGVLRRLRLRHKTGLDGISRAFK